MPVWIIDERFVVEDIPPREGATARVYKARDHKSRDIVAVKLFESPGLEGELVKEIFLREVEALSSLRHSNIVKLIASGQDAEGRLYIALEWIEHSLIPYWDSLGEADKTWEMFAGVILEPILSALALAHSRQILHRDIKPSNILVSEEGVPKLVDFGIAKLLHSLRLGLTVSDFASRPFAPPEHGKGEASPRGDLFSLGITILRCLTPREFQITHDKLDDALYEADIPTEAERLVGKLVALNPDERPINAQVALNELQQIKSAQTVDVAARPRLHLVLLARVAEELRLLLGLHGRPEVEKAVLDDLSDQTAIYQYQRAAGHDDSYIILGRELSYHVGFSKEYGEAVLVVFNALQLSPSLIERRREQALALAADFSFSRPADNSKARDTTLRLREQVAEFTQRQKLQERINEERRLFRGWEAILRAKRDLEKSRERPISYTWFERQGSNVVFTLEQSPEDDLIGQARCGLLAGNAVVWGVVDDLVGNRLVLFVTRGDTGKLPQRGVLVVDTLASTAALKRQSRALDEAQYGRAERSDLGDLLVRPGNAKIPQPLTNVVPIQPDLDEAKVNALAMALEAPDAFVVQGPPGTGKTTWIAELACQYLERNPEKKVLLSAQTHIAVDNALTRIRSLRPTLRIVRVGPADRISAHVEDLQISEQLRSWGREVQGRSAEFLRSWARERGISDARLSLAADLETMESLNRKEGDLVQALHDAERETETASKMVTDSKQYAEEVFKVADQIEVIVAKKSSAELLPDLVKAARDYISTGLKLVDRLTASNAEGLANLDVQRSAADLKGQLEQLRAEIRVLRDRIVAVLGDESLARAGIRRLREAVDAKLATVSDEVGQVAKLQSLQREWALRFGYGAEFERALVSVADVVGGTCLGIAAAGPASDIDFDLVIIDEASKATPTEALVAMTRGKRWVLVGDQKQLPPFIDEALVKEGLLEKYDLSKADLEQTLFDRLVGLLPDDCKASLTVQHRMLPAIANLVSSCFYDGNLSSARSEFEGKDLTSILPKPVTWFSTSHLNRRHETRQVRADGSPSYQNLEEATRVREWLEKLEALAQRAMMALSVGVITGYSAQRDLLLRELNPSDRLRWQALSIEVNSVDAFQGREVDVLVYSVTRSNVQNVIGFLSSEARLNVALSRGRDALVIFGDADHCRLSGDIDNPFRRVLEHIETQTQDCRLFPLNDT